MTFGRTVSALTLAFVTSLAATAAVAGQRPAPRAATSGLPPALEARIRDAALGELDRYGNGTPVPGLVLGVWTPRGALVEGIGVARLQPLAPMRIDDRMRIGSATVTFVATAILQLVDDGKLRLDEPLGSVRLPIRVRDAAHVTIGELLAMRSGIVDFYTLPEVRAIASDPNAAVDRDRLVALACERPRRFPPGTRWEYSNTNYLLLGMVLESLTHEDADRAISERVLRPLRLMQTSFPTRDRALPEPFAHGYAPVDDGWLDVSSVLSPALTWTAGAMISDAADMRRWTVASATGRLLRPATQRARVTCAPTSSPELRYGLGISCAGGWLGYTGGVPGYATAAYYLPGARTTIVAFVTTENDVPRPGVANAIFRAVARLVTPGSVPYRLARRARVMARARASRRRALPAAS